MFRAQDSDTSRGCHRTISNGLGHGVRGVGYVKVTTRRQVPGLAGKGSHQPNDEDLCLGATTILRLGPIGVFYGNRGCANPPPSQDQAGRLDSRRHAPLRRSARARSNFRIDIPTGIMVGVILRSDGAGKSTLLGLMAGSKKMQEGTRSTRSRAT